MGYIPPGNAGNSGRTEYTPPPPRHEGNGPDGAHGRTFYESPPFTSPSTDVYGGGYNVYQTTEANNFNSVSGQQVAADNISNASSQPYFQSALTAFSKLPEKDRADVMNTLSTQPLYPDQLKRLAESIIAGVPISFGLNGKDGNVY